MRVQLGISKFYVYWYLYITYVGYYLDKFNWTYICFQLIHVTAVISENLSDFLDTNRTGMYIHTSIDFLVVHSDHYYCSNRGNDFRANCGCKYLAWDLVKKNKKLAL